jgi:hypothetical protein
MRGILPNHSAFMKRNRERESQHDEIGCDAWRNRPHY